ncbi:hypothetical protein [Sphingomonas sp. PB4P5]|uniref:hypothetical protein n=1 Tax=Parasphingomonas puruogangriensis TaxID=3096155 RepID=UPI002FC6DB74
MSTISSITALLGIVMLSACGNTQPGVHATDADMTSANLALASPGPAAANTPISSTSMRAASGGVVGQCPPTVGSDSAKPAGVRRLGNIAATELPLTDASIATIVPEDYDPAIGNLNESEADEIDGDPNVSTASFSYAPSLEAVSLVCRYGKSVLPLSGEAMLLIPLKPQWAQCRFIAAAKGVTASMVCHTMKPID